MPRSSSKTTPKAVEIDRPRIPRVAIALVMVGILATAGSIMWGRTDAGQIDVASTINNAPERNTDPSKGAVQQAATAQHASMPNGGLVAQEGDAAPAPEPAPIEATTTATSTEVSAESEASEGEENTTTESVSE